MKIKKSQIREMIKEELLKEGTYFKQYNKIYTDMRNLVNDIQKRDIQGARKLNKIAGEFYDTARGLKIESVIKEYFHEKDDLLRGITFEDLIIAVQSNEKAISASSITKVFNEMVKANLKDAEYELKSNMKQIIKAAEYA